jgi:2-polyprenyl-3-methyl-5-hydroxy-6-metoxy-1,4-benzoquinol methylase
MKVKIQCPVCSKTEVKEFLRYQSNNVYTCFSCGVKFVFPPPKARQLKRYYRKGYFEGDKGGACGYKDYVSLESNLKTEAVLKLRLIQKMIKSGNLLDIGAGTGVFVEEARKKGFSVSANDISSFVTEALKERKIKCFLGPVNKKILPKGTFDIITAWDVVEHVFKINEMVEAMNWTLRRGGFLFLTTPDTESLDAKIMGKKWYGYKKIPEHLLFFNRKSITNLLERWNFEVIKIKRWGFYRDLNFMVEKLAGYDKSFSFGGKLLRSFSLGEASLFWPFADFLVVAKKKGK